MSISTVLLDFDGVIRHFDPEHVSEIEAKYGLPPGSLRSTAFSPDLLMPAITGLVTRQQWCQRIGDSVGSPTAAQEWMAERGQIDADVLALIRQIRSEGILVAVLTNGTDTIDEEMRRFEIADDFDAVFSTWHIGFAKPDPRAFQYACDRLEVAPNTVFFTDDSPSKMQGAVEIGMTARPFLGVAQLKRDLDELLDLHSVWR